MAKKETASRLPTSWSFSRYNVWRECPRKYKYIFIDKMPQPSNPAMERGIQIHLLLEGFVKGEVYGIPKDLEKIQVEVKNAKKMGALAEESWTITKDLEVTHAKDFQNAWLRAKIDLQLYFEDDAHLVIVDLKTGRPKPYIAQKELYAAMAPIFYKDLEEVSVELWFSDYGVVDNETVFNKKQLRALQKKWWDRGNRMLSDESFEATPSDSACKYCPFRSNVRMLNDELGPCEAWKYA